MNVSVKINNSKISRLIQESPKGLVLLSSWLVSKGYSYELQQRYRKSGWFKSIGKGAMLKSEDSFILSGALSAMQFQANLNIHVGGRSALELQGSTHYLQLASQEITLFAPGRTELPPWFTNNNWDASVILFKTSLFNNDSVGLTEYRTNEIKTNISNPARAMCECLSLCPDDFPLSEAFELMEGLSSLRPKQVQELLEECKSIKVKRLFLYFAERAGHSWFKYIDQSKINLGSGNRSLVANGVLTPKYGLVLPNELAK